MLIVRNGPNSIMPPTVAGALATIPVGQKVLRAAHEQVATLVKAKRKFGRAGDADSNGLADGLDGQVCHAEPERSRGTKVDAVEAAVDAKGGGEAAGATGQVKEVRCFAMALHLSDAFKRLHSAYENGGSRALRFADDVQHEMRAIVEENISMAGSKVHRTDSRRWTAEVVTRGIAGRVGFHLDDAPAETSRGKIVHNNFANQEARELGSCFRKFITFQTAQREFFDGTVHRKLSYLPGAGLFWPSDGDRMRRRSSGETRS